MRIKPSKSRSQKAAAAPLPDRRRSRRRGGFMTRNHQSRTAPLQPVTRKKAQPLAWMAILAIAGISMALISLIWITTSRSVDDPLTELRGRTEEQLRSIAGVIAVDLQRELLLIDQSLAIIQDDWKKDSDSVNIGQWRKQALALTSMADDIFIADERRIIVQGTLPQSVGQGFGTAYVSYTNGSLEVFEADGTKTVPGRVSSSTIAAGPMSARQYLMYVLRPLDRPRGWFVGASFRSEQITKLFGGANLGPNGVVALIETQRGNLQAIAGPAARGAPQTIANTELFEAIKKNESGAWTGQTPFDKFNRYVVWRRVPGRDLAALASLDTETALLPAQGLAGWAYGLATMGTLLVLTVAGLVLWGLLTTLARQRRKRALERAHMDLANARQELDLARARIPLTEAEAGALVSSQGDGVARLDQALRLRQWNARFAQWAGQGTGEDGGGVLDAAAVGAPIEALWRAQAGAGLFGDPAEGEQEVAKRLTVLHTGVRPAEALTQRGPEGETLTLHTRSVADGGHVLIVAGSDNATLAALPPVPADTVAETADETTNW